MLELWTLTYILTSKVTKFYNLLLTCLDDHYFQLSYMLILQYTMFLFSLFKKNDLHHKDSSWNSFLWHNPNFSLIPRCKSLSLERSSGYSLWMSVTVTGKTSSCLLFCTMPHGSFLLFCNLRRCVSLATHVFSGLFSLA